MALCKKFVLFCEQCENEAISIIITNDPLAGQSIKFICPYCGITETLWPDRVYSSEQNDKS